MSIKNILVTGASGFIGSCLIKQLLSQNFQIRVLVRDKTKKYFSKEVEVFEGDLTDPKSLIDVCKGIDTVFHLAGYAHAWAENNKSYTDNHYAINYLGTENLCKEIVKEKVKRLIFFSSVKAVLDNEKCIDESWTAQPNSSYGIAKRKAENLTISLKNKHDIHVCILRLSLVYGMGWKGNLENMFNAINRGVFPPIPETNNRRSMVSVEDVCQAAILAATHPAANGKIYFVTDGQYYSTYQIYILMLAALGKNKPKWHIPLKFFKLMSWLGDMGYRITGRRMPFNSEAMTKLFGSASYSSRLIELDLGFKPKYDLEKMLSEIITANK